MSRWNLITALALLIAVSGTASAQSKLSADDHAEIQQLYIKYSRAIDSGDAEGYAATFTSDGRNHLSRFAPSRMLTILAE